MNFTIEEKETKHTEGDYLIYELRLFHSNFIENLHR